MKIAYVISETYSISKYNGIRMQAEIWATELIRQGENVIKVNPWEYHNWGEYDIVHIFGPCEFILNFASGVFQQMPRIVFSPIIDTVQSIPKYKIASLWGCDKLRLASPNYTIRQARKYISHWFARSEYELHYIQEAYDVPLDSISIIPLSFRVVPDAFNPVRKNYCLHVSRLTDGRKNVIRLIKSAIKYRFQLVLAGSISSEEEFFNMKTLIDNNDNISYLGRVSDERLLQLYQEAKVFALPSINEGVGMVAVEAAACGCDIVITDKGGPKEYYNGMAKTVNPYSIKEIGTSILSFLTDTTYQPQLRNYVLSNYSLYECVKRMRQTYMSIIKK